MENAAAAPQTSQSSQGQSQSQGEGEGQNFQGQQSPEKVTATSNPEIFEVKVNGKIMKMTRDELIANASMGYAAHDRFSEASKLSKKAESILNKAKGSPIEALMEAGLNKEQIREAMESWYSREFIEPETLTPEQKRSKDMERELEKYRNQEKQTKEQQEKEQLEKLTSVQREHLQNQIIDAMDKSGLPKTKFFASRMAFYMRQNLMNGFDAPLEVIVSQVDKERQQLLGDIVESSDYATLKRLFGDGIIQKIHKGSLEELRSSRKFPGQSQASSSDGYGNKSNEKVYSSDVNRRLREMRTGKR